MIAALPEASATPTRPTDTARMRTRRVVRRWWWVWLAVVAVTAVGLVNRSDGTTTTELHPRNPGPDGAMAAAEILKREGVDIVTVTTLPDALASLRGPSTLLVANLQYFSENQLRRLAAVGADVVVVGNPYLELGPLTDAVAPSIVGTTSAVTAQCGDPDAVAASRITSSIGGVEALRPGVEVCFPTGDGVGAYAVWEQSGQAWRYLADGALMTNAMLGQDGNAALALRALGHNERLVWLLPTAESATVEQVSPMPPVFTPLAVLAGHAQRMGPQRIIEDVPCGKGGQRCEEKEQEKCASGLHGLPPFERMMLHDMSL